MTTVGASGAPYDPARRARFSFGPWAVAIICALAMVAEGFDTYSIGYAAPLIVKAWGLSPATLGLLFATNVIASALGTMGIGPIADRHGRKPCLVAVLFVFGITTFATAHVSGLATLAIARTLSSLALGASVPIAIALAGETAPMAHRSSIAALVSGGIAVGIVVSSLTAAALVPAYGWPALMYAGGLLAIALAVPILLFVAEPVPTQPSVTDEGRGRVADLFTPAHRSATAICLFVLTMVFAVSFFFNFWLPSLLLKVHGDVRDVALATALAQSMSPVGAFIVGRGMDRLGLRALAFTFALAAIALTIAVNIGSNFMSLAAGFCLVCLFMNGAFGGAVALPVRLFPSNLRATALGFTIGGGRLVGGSFGPMVGGWLLARNLPTSAVAVAFGPPLLLAAFALFLFARRPAQ